MKKNFLTAAAMAIISLSALCSSASASVSECDYSRTYDDPKTLYVSRDGSGDFNCDGTDDQVEINQAFQAVKNSAGGYTSVFLKSGTYIIGARVDVVSNSVLEGDKDAILKLKDQANWTVNISMIGSSSTGIDNVEIKCFEANMNYDGNFSTAAYDCMAGRLSCTRDNYSCCEAYSTSRTTGKGYYNVAGFNYGSNYSMHDMYLHDGLNDGLSVMNSADIKFYDNFVYKMGHEGAYVKYSYRFEAYGNTITNRTNSGLRADNTNNVSFHNNEIQAFDHWSAGGPGIEIVKDSRSTIPMNDINIFNNYIHGTYGPGIWITASGTYASTDLAAHIHHNIFSETGINPSINWTAGILTAGFYNLSIENNVFDRVYNGGLIISNAVAAAPSSSGYVTTFRNNIITNTSPIRNTATNGYGIMNLLPSTHTINSENNCFFGNIAGDYSGAVIISGDIDADPLFADALNHDYHLRSSWGRWDGTSWVKDLVDSPCIDAGYATSDYSFEPAPNGGRIDIGRYGNTGEASKSPSTPTTYILAISGGTGSGSYLNGQSVTINADAPVTGKMFDKWIGDIAYVSDINSADSVVTMPNSAISLTATYKDIYYDLAISSGTGSGSYLYGSQINIAADAAATGKVFAVWTGDISYLSNVTSPTATVTMPAQAISLTATYKDAPVLYKLTVSGGSGSGSYSLGTKITITANAAPAGKVFVGWTGSTGYISSTTSATTIVTMPAKAITLTANYKTAYYLTVKGGTGSGWYASGTKVVVAANPPEAGKVFSKWTASTNCLSSTILSITTVTMPTKAVIVTANYMNGTYQKR